MKRRRWLGGLLAAILVTPLLAGCGTARRETEELAFVLALGVDKGRKPGLYNVTSMIAIPGKLAGGGEGGGGGGGGGGDSAVMVTTVEAPNLAQAISLVDTYTSRRATLVQAKGLVVGEELAKQGINPVVQELTRMREARQDMHLVVSRGDAAKALSGMKSKLEKDPSRYLELEALSADETGYMPSRSQLFDFTTALVDPGRSPVSLVMDLHKAPDPGEKPKPPPEADKLAPQDMPALSKAREGDEPGANKDAAGDQAGGDDKKGGDDKGGKPGAQEEAGKASDKVGSIARTGGDPMELVGAALFREDRLQGYLTGPEVQLLLMATGDLKRTVITVPEPGQPGSNVSLTISSSRKPTITARLVNGEAQIQETIRLEATLNVVGSGRNLTTEDQLAELQRAVSQDLSQRVHALVQRIMDTGLDPFGYGDVVAHSFATNDAWQQYRWRDHRAKATVTIAVDLKLRRFGMQLAPLQMGGDTAQ